MSVNYYYYKYHGKTITARVECNGPSEEGLKNYARTVMKIMVEHYKKQQPLLFTTDPQIAT